MTDKEGFGFKCVQLEVTTVTPSVEMMKAGCARGHGHSFWRPWSLHSLGQFLGKEPKHEG